MTGVWHWATLPGMADLTILIPAAGASGRMRGADKLLQDVDGLPMLRRQAAIALAVSPEVVVTLPPDNPARAAALQGLAVQTRLTADAAEGMAASIRGGVAAALSFDEARKSIGLMILPADMPDLGADDLRALRRSFMAAPDRILRATAADGTPGHPVIFPPDLYPELAALRGDEGARSVLMRHPDRLRMLALPGRRALIDLDTPEDWAAWRAAR